MLDTMIIALATDLDLTAHTRMITDFDAIMRAMINEVMINDEFDTDLPPMIEGYSIKLSKIINFAPIFIQEMIFDFIATVIID